MISEWPELLSDGKYLAMLSKSDLFPADSVLIEVETIAVSAMLR